MRVCAYVLCICVLYAFHHEEFFFIISSLSFMSLTVNHIEVESNFIQLYIHNGSVEMRTSSSNLSIFGGLWNAFGVCASDKFNTFILRFWFVRLPIRAKKQKCFYYISPSINYIIIIIIMAQMWSGLAQYFWFFH